MMTAIALPSALILDALLGEPKKLWSRISHPAVLMGRLIGFLDRCMNSGTALKARGVLCITFVVAIGWLVGVALSYLGPIAEISVVAILLAQRSLVEHVSDVAQGLRQSLANGRAAVSMIVSRDTAEMDETQTARAAIESAAENLSDGVVAPVFWFLLGGLPGIIAYKMVNTADSMIGYRTPKHMAFGWASARLDDVLNFIPARLTALLIAMVSRIWRMGDIRADARLHRSPNAGWPEAAMARALGIALSGPRMYDGEMRTFSWVNSDGRRSLTPEDIDAAITILWKAWSVMLALSMLCVIVTV